MSFQAEVGTFLAAQMLARSTVGQRFGLKHEERIADLRFESGKGVDDVIVTLTGGGKASLQCKTTLSLSDGEKSDFSKTMAQFVEELVADPTLDVSKNALVIAVPSGKSASLDPLAAACARVAAGGLADIASGSQAERDSFAKLKTCVDRAYSTQAPGASPDYGRLAGLLRVVRFHRGASGAMRIDGAASIGRALYGGEAAGVTPFTVSIDIVREHIKSGHSVDATQFLAELRRRGQVDVSAPGYDADFEKIASYAKAERERVARFGRLPIADYQLTRRCQPALFDAARAGSFLVIGEPGAGKTGALGILAEQWDTRGPLVVLGVDQFAGITRTRDLSDELRLEHDFVEVLAAWPGVRPGLLVIDALDAARGGQAEAIFVGLIERMSALAPRWRVVASVRTFDLLNGQRLRGLMPGLPPSAGHSDPRASMLRHFLLPALDNGERAAIARDVPDLAALLATSNAKLSALLGNIFNLSLAADLVAQGVPAANFESIATQSDLIDRYEDERLPGAAARSAMIAAVANMVDLGALTLRAAELDHPGLEALLASGIVEDRDDRYGFAHHILFDHVAGRFFIDTSAGDRLIAQLKSLGAKAFMLAPALRFALERFWRRDASVGRAESWKLLIALAQQRDLGPIAAASALRTAAEQVQASADLGGLNILVADGDLEALNHTLFQIARFVAMHCDAGGLTAQAAIAWAGLAERIALRGERLFVEPARFLLYPLSQKADLADPAVLAAFGRAARAGLRNACAQDRTYRHARSMGVGFVGQSYASDPDESRDVLRPMLTPEWLTPNGHEDAAPLARALKHIVPIDPDFVEEVFRAIFNQPVPSDAKTDMSGSRILGLSSTEAQDFKHSFYYLKKAFRQVLATRPERAAALFTIVSLAKQTHAGRGELPRLHIASYGDAEIVIILDGLDQWDWRQPSDYGDTSDVDIPVAFAVHVAGASAADLEIIVRSAREAEMAASVWRRLFGGQLEPGRRGAADALLWPVAANPAVLESRDLGRDAIDFLRAVYPTIDVTTRTRFEEGVALYQPADTKQWTRMRDRLVSALPRGLMMNKTLKRRRAALARKDGLRANVADYSFYSPQGRMLRPGRPDEPLSKADRASLRIEKAAARCRKAETLDRLLKLWDAIRKAIRLADRGEIEADDVPLLWGAIASGFATFTARQPLAPGTEGIPPLADLLALLERLAHSDLPGENEDSLSFSNDAVRVHAAKAAMNLGRRFLLEVDGLAGTIETLLADKHAAVRNVIAERLNWLKADPVLMWRQIEQVSTAEPHAEVLTFFVARAIAGLAEGDPDRVEPLLVALDGRAEGLDEAASSTLGRMIAQLATELAVDDGRAAPMALIEGWAAGHPIKSGRLGDVLQMLRGRFFYSYLPAEDPRHAAGARARHLGQTAGRAAAAQMTAAKAALPSLQQSDPGRTPAVHAYIGADRTMDQFVSQLFFGSGAHKDSGPTDISLKSAVQKRAFFDDWSTVLLEIEAAATPHTIKYLLEVYEHLLDADPPLFFERIAAFVLGPAAAEYYQHEQLAASDLVQFVRHMLADHRSLLDHPAQRDRLVAILGLFADAGWPEAMRLLWELPDLLR